MIEYPLVFLVWTLLLYWMHRLAHVLPIVREWHWDHHYVITVGSMRGPHWTNLLLFADTWKNTADTWFTEVVPTLILCFLTGHWWLFLFYYIWTAIIHEAIEHNPNIDFYPWLTSGKWHLVHHSYEKHNFGLIWPIWDIVFGTWKSHEKT